MPPLLELAFRGPSHAPRKSASSSVLQKRCWTGTGPSRLRPATQHPTYLSLPSAFCLFQGPGKPRLLAIDLKGQMSGAFLN